MRTSPYTNEQVPGTLGEYRDLCASLGGESCRAVQWLDEKIEEHELATGRDGRKEEVLQADPQMRALLLPMIMRPRLTGEPETCPHHAVTLNTRGVCRICEADHDAAR